MNIKLATVNLEVSNLSRSRAFYAGTLGLAEDQDRSHPPSFAYLRSPAADLTLMERRAAAQPSAPAATLEIGFVVDDVTPWRRRLEEAHVQCQPQSMGWGDALELHDPDGHRVIIYKLHQP